MFRRLAPNSRWHNGRPTWPPWAHHHLAAAPPTTVTSTSHVADDSTTQVPGLAWTGADIVLLLMLGLLLTSAGVGILLLDRRRQAS